MNTRMSRPASDLPLRDTKYRELERHPEFGFVTAWLRDLVPSIVPNARMSEREYWSVACLPDDGPTALRRRLLSVHAGNLEVASVVVDLAPSGSVRRGERRLGGYVRVALAELEHATGTPVAQLGAVYPALTFAPEESWVTVGWVDLPESREQFAALPWRSAARVLVAELMRSGRNSKADSHCPQIAQFAFDD